MHYFAAPQRPLLLVPAVASQVHGFLSNPTSQAQSYWFLGSAALATALLCLTVPGAVARVMLSGQPDAVVQTLVRAAGATLVTSATVKYTLKVRKGEDELGVAINGSELFRLRCSQGRVAFVASSADPARSVVGGSVFCLHGRPAEQTPT